MNTYLALVRGINIVGKRQLPMSELKRLLERSGCADVQTYIQSGNAIFRIAAADTTRIAGRLSAAVLKSRGFQPQVLILTRGELQRAAAGNPFPEADGDPRSVHLFFLAARPARPDLKAIDAVKAATERYLLKGRVFYLHTPDGFGSSKLAERVERLLGVQATARNWRTVTTLLSMMKAIR